MADNPNVVDWTTAISTAATAFATLFGGIAAWLSFRRDVKTEIPVIEPYFDWTRDKTGTALISLRVVVRNQLQETIGVDSARIVRPRHSTMFARHRDGNVLSDCVTLDVDAAPIGEIKTFAATPFEADRIYIDLFIVPPKDWLGGKVRVDLHITSRAVTARQRRIVIKRRMSEAPAMHTDEKAKSAG